MHICIGLDEKEGNKLYDSAILIDDEGIILLKHRKINVLPELMTPPYSVGDDAGVVRTKFGTIGVIMGCPVIGTDLIGQVSHGPWTGQVYGGQSAAYDPKSGVLVVGKDRERDIATITIQVNK